MWYLKPSAVDEYHRDFVVVLAAKFGVAVDVDSCQVKPRA